VLITSNALVSGISQQIIVSFKGFIHENNVQILAQFLCTKFTDCSVTKLLIITLIFSPLLPNKTTGEINLKSINHNADIVACMIV
jgi:hypothetical protein